MEPYGLLFEAIFEHALDLPPGGAREAYVAAVCGDDADLRAQVDAFLEAEEATCQSGPFRSTGPELRVTPETWPRVEFAEPARVLAPADLQRIRADQDAATPPGRLRSA